ncbi:MAG: patatin-like phospholipase family protein [Flavobacteriales bacterium]|nr:patatin-like phospholipase family protein [Flavobacteriales bacterium]MBK9598310.1 patatin-like phospholipase family protein [Flavobacteriales bacterium]
MAFPNDIEYLCFEGGGGKGLVYLGALRALEEAFTGPVTSGPAVLVPVAPELPYYQPPPDTKPLFGIVSSANVRKLKGVSGSSAGTITAFMVALGPGICSSEMLAPCHPFRNPRQSTTLYCNAVEILGKEKVHDSVLCRSQPMLVAAHLHLVAA